MLKEEVIWVFDLNSSNIGDLVAFGNTVPTVGGDGREVSHVQTGFIYGVADNFIEVKDGDGDAVRIWANAVKADDVRVTMIDVPSLNTLGGE